jgi:hypothetical protein
MRIMKTIYVVMSEQHEYGALHCAHPEAWFTDEAAAKAYAAELEANQDRFKYVGSAYVAEVETGGLEDGQEETPQAGGLEDGQEETPQAF